MAKYKDEDWLREKYVDENYTDAEIAEMTGVSEMTIGRYRRKHNISTRSRSEAAMIGQLQTVTPIYINSQGYLEWCHTYRHNRSTVRVHRLAAVAWFGLDAVKDNDVHHVNDHKVNYEDNIEVLTKEEHVKEHRMREKYPRLPTSKVIG